jgi:hypothetical protein
MRLFILLSITALILTSFFQGNQGIPQHMKPPPCADPCSNCRIDSMEREYRWGRATLAQYESFKNDELARIKSRCQSPIPPPIDDCDETIENCRCSNRAINLYVTAGNWEFKQVSYTNSNGKCIPVPGSVKSRLTVSAPEPVRDGAGPFRFITRINPKGILPFEDKYPAWQSDNGFDLEMPDGCASVECFFCENHGGHHVNQDRNTCGNLDKFLSKLEAIQRQEYKFSAVVPGQTKTWLVCTDAAAVPIPAIEPEWFTKAFREKKFEQLAGQVYWQDCLKNLAWLGTYDRNFEILGRNINARRFLVGLRVDGRYYELGVHSGGFYHPLDDSDNPERSKKLLFALTSNPQNHKIWSELLQDWFQGKEQYEVTDFIPSGWTNTDDPLNAIGRQTAAEGLNRALMAALEQKVALDLVLQSVEDNTHKVWRSASGKKEEVGAAENWLNSPNLFLRLLALSDLSLNVLAEDTGNGKLVFIYKKNTQSVWSWLTPQRTALQYHRLLKGETTLAYSGQTIKNYIERLLSGVSDDERAFLLRFADNPAGFSLVDLYPYAANVHVVLYTVPEEPYQDGGKKIFRMSSQNGVTLAPMQLLLVDLDWGNVPGAYAEWKRALLKETLVANATIEDIEIWLSGNGIGFSRKDGIQLLDVYPSNSCGFTRVPMNRLQNLITDVIYKGGAYPDTNALFKDWLVMSWDKNRWRANPKGILARCQ